MLNGNAGGPGNGALIRTTEGKTSGRASAQKAATGGVNLVIGVAIWSLVYGVSMRATRRYVVRREQPTYPPSRAAGDGYS